MGGATASSFVVGEYRIICLADDQVPSRRSAARRRDKTSSSHPAFFYLPFFRLSSCKSPTAASYATQRPGPTWPRDPVNLHLRGPDSHHPKIPSPYRPISQALLRGPIDHPSGGCPSQEETPVLHKFSSSIRLPPRPRPVGTPKVPDRHQNTSPPAMPSDLCLRSHASGATRHCATAMASCHGSSPVCYRGGVIT